MSISWVVVYEGTLENKCLRCGQKMQLAGPWVDVDIYVAAANEFLRKHQHCPEPAPQRETKED